MRIEVLLNFRLDLSRQLRRLLLRLFFLRGWRLDLLLFERNTDCYGLSKYSLLLEVGDSLLQGSRSLFFLVNFKEILANGAHDSISA